MKRFVLACGLVVGLGMAAAGEAAAQGIYYPQPSPNPYAKPVLSPYLQLARGGNPAIYPGCPCTSCKPAPSSRLPAPNVPPL